jgi:CHAD domain-containing protein
MTARRKQASAPRELAAGSRCVAEAIRGQQEVLSRALAHATEAGVEDVHRSRVAARRLRSLLKTFRPLLEVRRARLYRVDLRSFARTFTAVREADVLAALLLELARTDPAFEPTDLQRLALALDDYREGARSALLRHMNEPGWRALSSALLAQSEEGQLLVKIDASTAQVMSLVADSWHKSLRLLKKHPESAAELHQLRLALKHCRYALEAVADAKPREATELLNRLRAAQDGIGEHRDTIAALHWVGLNARSLGRMATRRLAERLEAREKTLRARAARRSGKVLPAYVRWSAATRSIRKAVR